MHSMAMLKGSGGSTYPCFSPLLTAKSIGDSFSKPNRTLTELLDPSTQSLVDQLLGIPSSAITFHISALLMIS